MALPTTWTYPISRRFNAKPLLEVAIDPDGKNIKLDGFNDLASAPNLVSEFVINPEQMQAVVVNDLTLQLNDVQQYFNKFNRRLGPNNFRNTYALLEVAITATNNFCFTNLQKVTYDTTAYDNCRIFMVGDTVKVTEDRKSVV